MERRVFTAAQLRTAVNDLLYQQSRAPRNGVVVAYKPDEASPLAVKTTEYVDATPGVSVVCTANDLLNYAGTGTMDGLVEILTCRIRPGGPVTLEHLLAATDPDNIAEVFSREVRFDDDALEVYEVFRELQFWSGSETWSCTLTDDGLVRLHFSTVIPERPDGQPNHRPTRRVEVFSRRPKEFRRRDLHTLAEGGIERVLIEIGRSTSGPGLGRVLDGALARAFARRAWDTYMEHLLAEKLQRDLP